MIRVGLAGWSAWIVYVLVGTMQIVLIAFAIIFAIRDRKKDKEDKPASTVPQFEGWTISRRERRDSGLSHAPSNIAPDEHSPLLANGKKNTAAQSRP